MYDFFFFNKGESNGIMLWSLRRGLEHTSLSLVVLGLKNIVTTRVPLQTNIITSNIFERISAEGLNEINVKISERVQKQWWQ